MRKPSVKKNPPQEKQIAKPTQETGQEAAAGSKL
jgi:hypothetical protein